MIKNKYFYLFALLILLIVGCKSGADKINTETLVKIEKPATLYGTWKLSHIDTLYNVSNEELAKITKKHARNGLLLNFFPENMLTRIEGQKYTSTTWNFNGLKSAVSVGKVMEGSEAKFDFGFDKIEGYEKDGGKFIRIENPQGVFHFKKVGETLANINEDPFHPKNNQWRVIAPASETYIQMKKRILNYTQHNYYLFKSTKERGGDKVVNSNSIGIFLYYDGAIGLIDGGKVPSSWMANFYSPDEAMDGYTFVKDYFKGGFIRKKSPGGFVASGEAIFKDLVDKMEKDFSGTK